MELRRRAGAAVRRLRRRPDDVPQLFPPGAFYSPVVDAALVLRDPDHRRIWPAEPIDPVGIDVRADAQLQLLGEVGSYALPSEPRGAAQPYDPTNDQFPPQDAALLYGLLRVLRPARMIEVGCGWSTTVATRAIVDGELATKLTCIDPYPRDFLSSLPTIHELRAEKVEHTPWAVFDALQAGDVLFVDSSHVVKTGSDVVHLLLQVVPRLRDGVVVHVHDIFLPEDYPDGWVRAGFGWNEQYLLQALLVGNPRTHMLAMNHWLALRHPDAVRRAFGEIELNGSSVWFVLGPEPGPLRSSS